MGYNKPYNKGLYNPPYNLNNQGVLHYSNVLGAKIDLKQYIRNLQDLHQKCDLVIFSHGMSYNLLCHSFVLLLQNAKRYCYITPILWIFLQGHFQWRAGGNRLKCPVFVFFSDGKKTAWKTAVAANLTINFTLKTSNPVVKKKGTFLGFPGGSKPKKKT